MRSSCSPDSRTHSTDVNALCLLHSMLCSVSQYNSHLYLHCWCTAFLYGVHYNTLLQYTYILIIWHWGGVEVSGSPYTLAFFVGVYFVGWPVWWRCNDPWHGQGGVCSVQFVFACISIHSSGNRYVPTGCDHCHSILFRFSCGLVQHPVRWRRS